MSYWGDVEYEVWRHGGNPDAVDRDRCDDAMDRGVEAEDHARTLMREAADRRNMRESERQQAEWEYEQYLRDNEKDA